MVRLTLNRFRLVLLFLAFTAITSCVSSQQGGSSDYVFYGGPQRGTYTVFANAISDMAEDIGISMTSSTTRGSIENVRRVHSDRSAISIAYASHVYQARNGMMEDDMNKYTNIMVLGYFYGAPAQLFVSKSSGITSAYQLKGKRVSVGRANTGTYHQAKTYFSQLGNWDALEKIHTDYRSSNRMFLNNELDACWLFTSFPSSLVSNPAYQKGIVLLQIYDDGEKAGLFQKHPYFAKVIIPPNTYPGVDYETRVFQDSALWIAHKDVPEDVVYKLLHEVYSDDGINHLRGLTNAARMLVDNDGSFAISTPLHPGAVKFYKK